MNLDLGIYREGVTIQKDWVDVDKPARLILRLLFGFASDSVSIWQTQPIYKYWGGNAFYPTCAIFLKSCGFMDVKVLCVNLIQLGPSPFNSFRQCKKSSLRHHFRHNSRKLGSQKLLPQVNFQCGSKNIFSQCQRSRGYIWAKYSHRLPPGEISSDLYRDQFLGKFLNSSHLIFIFMFLT